MLKAFITAILAVAVCACSLAPPTSLGDSPVREIRCPSFLDRDSCLERAERQCESGKYTVLSQPPEPDDIGEGRTVAIEGTIKYRIITVRCEADE